MHEDYIVEVFSTLWWKGLLLSITGIVIILIAGKFSDNETKNKIRIATGVFLIGIALYLPVYQLSRGEWKIGTALPLNLCSLSAILSGIALLWQNQLAYEFLLYWGVTGASYSLLTPEMTLGNTGWYPYDYYISHAGIILSCLYLTLHCQLRPRPFSWLKVFAATQLLIVVVGIIDKVIGANYMYLMRKPAVENPFVVGQWPWYVLGFEAAGLLHFFVIYLIFKKQKQKRNSSKPYYA